MTKKYNKKIIARLGEYMVGGTLYFWVGYALFAFAYSALGWNWFWAKVLGDIVGRVVNYVVQRYWTFSDTNKSESVHMERYVVITVASIVIDYAIVGGLKALGLSPYIGQLISAGFFTIWNYLWYKYWVFPEKTRK